MELLHTLNFQSDSKTDEDIASSMNALENGSILFFPDCAFEISLVEQMTLTDVIVDKKHKNISFNPANHKIGGMNSAYKNSERETMLKTFMHRFAQFANKIITEHLPYYKDAVVMGRTSYRPAQIEGRPSSKRKDDTRLHIDAFPSTPVNGLRIMRLFCNINFDLSPRVWQVGESLDDVIERYYPTVPNYSIYKAKLLKLFKATKSLRSRYDHFMLHIHDHMKLDDQYQNTVAKQTIEFPSQSAWIVFTDQVSHAALKGQQLLEQTFYLPTEAMSNPSTAPLSILSKRWKEAEPSLSLN